MQCIGSSRSPDPIKTSSKEQDMIDLLSITLSSNPSPPPTASHHWRSPVSVSPSGPGSPHTPQQSYTGNQGYVPYNSYVAPWAQPRMPQIPSSYPPPPWEGTTSSANAHPFAASSNQFQASTVSSYASGSYLPLHAATQIQQQYNSFRSQVNSSPRQTGYEASPKPYIPANKLFEDLIDLKASERSVRPSSTPSALSGSPGQGMIGGRK